MSVLSQDIRRKKYNPRMYCGIGGILEDYLHNREVSMTVFHFYSPLLATFYYISLYIIDILDILLICIAFKAGDSQYTRIASPYKNGMGHYYPLFACKVSCETTIFLIRMCS